MFGIFRVKEIHLLNSTISFHSINLAIRHFAHKLPELSVDIKFR